MEYNFKEMENLRLSVGPEPRFKVDLKSGDSLQETVAAITIQRAWRRYRTKILVSRYSKINFRMLQPFLPYETFVLPS